MDYRQQYYDRYVSVQVQPKGGTVTEQGYASWADAMMAHLGGWLAEDLTTPILDVGCGSGNLLYLYRRLGYTNLTGIDISPEQIQFAKSQFPEATLVQGDVRVFLKDSVEQYGLISAFDVVEHFRKEEIFPLLNLFHQALKPGGRLILQTPDGGSPFVGNVAYGDFSHEWFFTPASLEHVLGLFAFEGYQARERRPYIHGAGSWLRFWLWRVLRLGLAAWNMIETGGTDGIYSRVFLASVVKAYSSA